MYLHLLHIMVDQDLQQIHGSKTALFILIAAHVSEPVFSEQKSLTDLFIYQ